MYTHIEILLDRSGSMASIKSAMESGIAEFVNSQKKVEGHCTFSLWQFDDHGIESEYRFAPIAEVGKIELNPRGCTPLYDSICRRIDSLGDTLRTVAKDKRPDKLIFVIITDGLENASTEFKRVDARDRITHQRNKYQWEFLFMGANQDSYEEAKNYGIPRYAAINYTSSGKGVRNMLASFNDVVTSSRLTGQAVAYSPEQQKSGDLVG